MITSFLIYCLCGVIAGLLAGLLGVGGGIVIVPMLVYIFPTQGIPPELIHHMALGTSLATIVLTSISSARAHNSRGAVLWNVFGHITPGILIGTFTGGLIASHIPTVPLKVVFICFQTIVAIQMFSNYRPPATREMPGKLGTSFVGVVIGIISSFVGIGGGTLSVPFMTFCNIDAHKAIGTSASIGFPIALAGTLSYIIGGWSIENLPPYCLGYVNFLAFFGISITSFFTAPIGAKISHNMSIPKLKFWFACFLLCIVAKMIFDLVK